MGDGTDHVFHLSGTPQKPLALDHIVIKCEAKKRSVVNYKLGGKYDC
jgi:hypothetical protein